MEHLPIIQQPYNLANHFTNLTIHMALFSQGGYETTNKPFDHINDLAAIRFVKLIPQN